MQYLDPIFRLWPTLSDFASDAGVSYGTAKQMRRRDSIPARYWSVIVERAVQRGEKLSLEELAAAHAQRPRTARHTKSSEAAA
jgi:hypothetical protein